MCCCCCCCYGVQSRILIWDLLIVAFLLLWGSVWKTILGPPCCCVFVVVVVVGSNPENYSGTSLLLRWYIAFLLLLGDLDSVPDALKRTHLSNLTGIPYLNRLLGDSNSVPDAIKLTQLSELTGISYFESFVVFVW